MNSSDSMLFCDVIFWKKERWMNIATRKKLIPHVVSTCSYPSKTFGQVLVPRASIIELSLVTICGWRKEMTFNFYSCDNLWFIEAWIEQRDRCYQLTLRLFLSTIYHSIAIFQALLAICKWDYLKRIHILLWHYIENMIEKREIFLHSYQYIALFDLMCSFKLYEIEFHDN